MHGTPFPRKFSISHLKCCRITNAADGTEDHKIFCMQPGRACEAGLKLLKQSSTTTAGTCTSEMDDEEDPFAGLASADSDNGSVCSVPAD